jgi:hypothetical protein
MDPDHLLRIIQPMLAGFKLEIAMLRASSSWLFLREAARLPARNDSLSSAEQRKKSRV